jgi:hypothetical protein
VGSPDATPALGAHPEKVNAPKKSKGIEECPLARVRGMVQVGDDSNRSSSRQRAYFNSFVYFLGVLFRLFHMDAEGGRSAR